MQKLGILIQNINLKQFSLLAFFAVFILYGNTLSHEYTLDDAIVITQNDFTKQGFKGIADIVSYDSFTGFFGKEKQLVDGGRYRPLSIITFAIEYELWAQSPFASHLINVILYALIAVLIFNLVQKLFTDILPSKFSPYLALFTSLLFLFHPIHTEVVANIKGRDELLSLFFSLLAFLSILKYQNSNHILNLISAGFFLFLALLAKENAIAFLAIIPLAIGLFKQTNSNAIFMSFTILFFATLGFLAMRYKVLGGFQQNVATELMNNPFIAASVAQKYATILYTWLLYIKLLIFPHPLTYDYYPYHIALMEASNPLIIFSALIFSSLALFGIIGLKQKGILSFCMISFAATFSMVSNLLFPVGTFMNERFIFTPSLFWCIALVYLSISIFHGVKTPIRYALIIITIVITGFYTYKTIDRNKAWKNDFTLFTTDVKTSKNSAKSNCSAGGKLWEKGKVTSDKIQQENYYKQAENYLRKSLNIHKNYIDAWILLGNVLFDRSKDVTGSVNCYIEVLKRQNQNKDALNNADIVLQNSDDRKLQLEFYSKLQAIDSNQYIINYRLGVLHGRYFNNLPASIKFLSKAHQLNSQKVEALKDLGTAYGILGNEQMAYKICRKALELDKNDVQIYINLGIAAAKMGLKDESENYFKQAELLKSATTK